MTTLTLTRPIRVLDKDVTEITFREPTGADLVRCGFPVRILTGGATEIDTGAVARLIAALAGIPPNAVERLAIPDFSAAMTTVMGFFGASATAGSSSTDTSTAPASGAIN